MNIVIGTVAAVLVLAAVIMIVNYNSLVKLRQKTKNAWSQIEVQLQKRYDLIPNLVEIVKGYTQHESQVLEKIAELRTSWVNANTASERNEVDSEMTSALKSVMAVAENYPELKANENFILLQNQLSDTESKVAFSRQFYNDVVTMYNTRLEVFPANIFAKMFGFKEETLYQAESEQAGKSVKVQF